MFGDFPAARDHYRKSLQLRQSQCSLKIGHLQVEARSVVLPLVVFAQVTDFLDQPRIVSGDRLGKVLAP